MANVEMRQVQPDFTTEKFAAREYLDVYMDDPRATRAKAEQASRHTIEGHAETSHFAPQPVAISMQEGRTYKVK